MVTLPTRFPCQNIHSASEFTDRCDISRMQGVVYELLNERSEPMSLVLKTIPHGKLSAVTGFLPSMERKWAIGHRLALYCTTPTGGATPEAQTHSLQILGSCSLTSTSLA